MRNIRKPRPIPPRMPAPPRCTLLADGATAIFPFYFTNRTFRFEDLEQLTYLFSWDNSSIDYYELFDKSTGQIDEGSEESGYKFRWDPQTGAVSLIFSPEHVSNIPTETIINFEIVAKLKNGLTIMDRQTPVVVKRSIYGDLLDSTKKYGLDVPIASQSLLCSNKLSCNE